ncbi:pilus assembly protein CpaE [Shewanella sp. Actino-trap-3]|uniref:AAA family ATPase n=1 Tax=Shewanella sp. Actino-trap-3 TaxID=2058331 RepID=UPI000C325A89|nr:P-loop NTPase [Shewanella sp. Actino-trap-3]PKG77939.1 pilus assembly protein CpaE [Shewanella sp. Actino-trap-3]|tara:strand:+ start:45373 stop:46617 length:1245 start_codon:yes stop_codon:yes gene_type:complete
MEKSVRSDGNETFDTSSKQLINFYMPFPINVLLIGAQKEFLPQIETNLTQCVNLTWEKTSDLSGNKVMDVFGKPFNLVLLVLPNEELLAQKALACAVGYKVEIIILGRDTPQAILRHAIQLGVSDFIPIDAPDIELLNSLTKVSDRLSERAELAPVLAVVNGKGGAGASFISACLAVIAAERDNFEVALLDTDLHNGSLAHILGVEPKYFIADALQVLDDMDEVALRSSMINLGNLNLLAAAPFSLLNAHDRINLSKVSDLVWKCRQHFNQVILDISRGPESWNRELLANAKILIVAQQNLMIIRETKALVKQLVNHMGVDKGKIHILVNRYDKSNTNININDIKNATGIDSVYIVANDYKLASQCEDTGKPINKVAKRQRMYGDFKTLTEDMMPREDEQGNSTVSFWSRLLGK